MFLQNQHKVEPKYYVMFYTRYAVHNIVLFIIILLYDMCTMTYYDKFHACVYKTFLFEICVQIV